jgi:hypothetical protein
VGVGEGVVTTGALESRLESWHAAAAKGLLLSPHQLQGVMEIGGGKDLAW